MRSDKQTPVWQVVLGRLRQRHDRLGRLACDSLVPLEASRSVPERPPDQAGTAPVSAPLTAERQPEASAA